MILCGKETGGSKDTQFIFFETFLKRGLSVFLSILSVFFTVFLLSAMNPSSFSGTSSLKCSANAGRDRMAFLLITP